MNIWNENLVFFRQMKKLTQQQVAEKISVARSSVAAYEEGRANPNIDTLIKLSDLFGVTIDDMLRIKFKVHFTQKSSS